MAIKSTKLFTNLNRWPQKVFQTFLMNNVYRQCCLSLHYDCTSEAIRPLLICIDISNNHKTKKVFLQCCRRMIKTFTVPEELSERSPSRRWRKHSPSRRKNSPSRSRRKETHQAVRGNKTHQAGGGGVEAAPFSEATSSGHPEKKKYIFHLISNKRFDAFSWKQFESYSFYGYVEMWAWLSEHQSCQRFGINAFAINVSW